MATNKNLTSLFYGNIKNSIENFYPQTSTINDIMSESDNESYYSLKEVDEMLERIFTPYPNKDEIPVLEIKNEDCFFNKEKIIQSQLPNNNFNDEKFNICKNCENKNNKNRYFCKNCGENICEKCKTNCDNHDLIDLENQKESVKSQKNQIIKFLVKIANDSKKDKKKISFPFIIALIRLIIKKDYNNYFHYQNIKKCHEYISIYEKIYNNSFLNILFAVNEDINNKEKEKDYKIFGKAFVENNKDKIYLRINNKQSPLVEAIKINDDDKLIEVILIKESNNLLEDLSYMFCNCKSKSIKIRAIENGEKFLENVTNISKMFKDCSYLTEIDLHFFHIFKKLKDIDSLFSGCEELTNISNISHLYTDSVTKMDKIFNLCTKLKELNDIDRFKTSNVESFDEMFKDCSSLKELPKDISNWDMEKAKSLKGMFKGCSSLTSLPNIGRWKIEKVEGLKRMFKGCSSLTSLPNIGRWNVEKVESLKEMFNGCSSLMNLPNNIVDWKVVSVKNMKKMFSGCSNLEIRNLPDLKKWDLKNLKTMDKMFYGCSYLITREKAKIENIFKFNNIEKIFYHKVLTLK